MSRVHALLASLVLTTALALPGAAVARDTVVLAMQLEPPHLDPTAGAAAAIDSVTYQNIFQGLTRMDRDGSIQPGLAESWEVSDDGTLFSFKLRPGVTFSDGSALDPGDVVFSLERARGADSVNAQKALFEPIESVTADGEDGVAIKLARPVGAFLFNLAQGDAAIVAPESAENNKQTPVGTGPYVLDRWVNGERIVLRRRDGVDLPIREATIRIMTDPAAATAALMAGDIDAYPAFPAPEALAQLETDQRFTVSVGTTEGETILSTNNKRPPFDDVRVRRAVQHAIDRQAVIDGAYFGYGAPLGSHFPPHHPAYVDLTGVTPHDPAKARALLKEAGLAEGFEAVIKLPPPSYARRGGEIIAAQLAEVGIRLKIEPVEWAQWLEQVLKNKDYDLSIVSHVEPGDIGIYANPDYYFQYDSAEFRALIEELSGTFDEAKRAELLGRAQRMLANDAVNGFLFQLPLLSVYDKRLKGLWPNAPHPAMVLAELSWSE